MFDITISGFDDVQKYLGSLGDRVRKAEDRAIVSATAVARNAVRRQFSFTGGKAPIGQLGKRTGKTLAQVKAKYFRRADGSRGASVKVRGNRGFIAYLNELGTKSHGHYAGGAKLGQGFGRSELRNRSAGLGRGLPARKMFATAWQLVQRQVEQKLLDSFDQNIRKELEATGIL